MNFLNNGTGDKLFAEAALCDTYVDKTMMIDTLYRYVCAGNKYICVTMILDSFRAGTEK